MDEMLKTLNGLEILYLVCAFAGGLFFFIRLIMQFIGLGDHDGGFDGGLDGGIDGGFDIDAHHVDSDIGFKVLTLQGLTAFFMMFGLVGFALYREVGSGALISVLGATAAGMATVWVIGKLFSSMRKLQSSGTLEPVSAIGGEGTVYLTIPAGGTGKVQVSFKNRFREYDATAQDKQAIKTGERIRVVWADGRTLVVEKID
jgi:membrane protein implicated in regulation of membrane protease activity